MADEDDMENSLLDLLEWFGFSNSHFSICEN
jgi:hypothetical protein